MAKDYEITVMSTTDFDRLVAEITFKEKKAGVILSQERGLETFEISIYALVDDGVNSFYDTVKHDDVLLDQDVFLEAVTAAKNRLIALDGPRD